MDEKAEKVERKFRIRRKADGKKWTQYDYGTKEGVTNALAWSRRDDPRSHTGTVTDAQRIGWDENAAVEWEVVVVETRVVGAPLAVADFLPPVPRPKPSVPKPTVRAVEPGEPFNIFSALEIE
jgi:hypothetical protein